MTYPTRNEVEAADREQLCRWVRFQSSPTTEDERILLNRIVERWKAAGGFTAAISNRIGW